MWKAKRYSVRQDGAGRWGVVDSRFQLTDPGAFASFGYTQASHYLAVRAAIRLNRGDAARLELLWSRFLRK